MRLPLLIQGKPSTLKSAARVSLGKGRWSVSSNIVDSKVSIIRNASSSPLPESIQINGRKVIIEGECTVQVYIDEPGTERSLTIHAEQVP